MPTGLVLEVADGEPSADASASRRDGTWTMFPSPPPFARSGDEPARAVDIVECTIPAHMTIAQWRRTPSPAKGPSASRELGAVLRSAPRHEVRCDHLHDTTTRYDREAKRLDLLMFCSICGIEKLVESIPYEPRFEPNGATVHPLRPRRIGEPGRRAA